jgi:hypothetical protein
MTMRPHPAAMLGRALLASGVAPVDPAGWKSTATTTSSPQPTPRVMKGPITLPQVVAATGGVRYPPSAPLCPLMEAIRHPPADNGIGRRPTQALPPVSLLGAAVPKTAPQALTATWGGSAAQSLFLCAARKRPRPPSPDVGNEKSGLSIASLLSTHSSVVDSAFSLLEFGAQIKHRKICEDCEAKSANYGLPAQGKRRWCARCAQTNHPGSCRVTKHRKCEHCGLKVPTLGLPIEGKVRWCSGCAKLLHPDARRVHKRKKCEDCHEKVPSFGLEVGNKHRWCISCARRNHPGARRTTQLGLPEPRETVPPS